MDKYVCKVATVDEMNNKWNYEINHATKIKKIGLYGRKKILKDSRMVLLYHIMEF